MADDVVVDISFKGNGPEFLAELSRAVGRAKTQLQDLGQSTAQLSRLENTLARMSTQANQFAGSANKAAQATQGWSQKWVPFKGQFLEGEAASKKMWSSIDTGIASAEKSLARGTKAAQDFQDAQTGKSIGAVGRAPMEEWDKQFRALSVAADENAAKVRNAQKAIEDYQNSLSNARYVLYDVAGTLTVMGTALVAPLAGAIAVAVEFEKQFAQVARTSGLYGSELGALKSDLDELYSTIPVTYEDLSQIATLAGQLGVPAERIAQFTEVVAKTSAVTNLTAEQAATAFGRLDALIPTVKGQYDRLGSAIAKVGVNSVATESDIVNISTQISSMGAFAGFTAQDIIGLSGALASVGAPPELSRGTITRVFTLMSRAVSTGGKDLEKFAEVSGVSSQEFASTWGTDKFAGTFLKFMDGIKSQGGDAVSTLQELGITSVRDVPLLLRLANAADSTGKSGALLAQTIGDANQGWSENIELQRQYEIIAGTVSAKIELLVNNFNLFLQALGGPLLKSLGDVVDLLTDLTKGATDFVSTDFGGTIATTAIVLGGLLGVLALAGGAMALMGASSIGVYQALLFVSAQSPLAASALLGTAGAARLADGSMKASAASALLLSRALKSITIVGALILLPEAIKAAGDAIDDWTGIANNAAGAAKVLGTNTGDIFQGAWTDMIAGTGGMRNVFADFTNSLTGTGRAFMDLDDQMSKLIDGGSFDGVVKMMNEFAAASDMSPDAVLDMFGNITGKAKEAGHELEVYNGKIREVGGASGSASDGTDQASEAIAEMEAAAQAAEGALQEMLDALYAIGGSQITAGEAVDALQKSVNDAWAAIANGEYALSGTDNAAIAFRDTLRGMEGDALNAGEAVAKNGGSTQEAVAAWQLGRDQIVNLRVAMGESRDEAIAWADQNLGSAGEVAAAMEGVTTAVNGIPASKHIEITADTWGAQRAIEDFINANNGRRITIYEDILTSSATNWQIPKGVGRAGGGSVFGPGTSTSDSIIAALSNGEYVLRTAAAKAIGYGRLDYMNRHGKMPAFAGGGQVGSTTTINQVGPQSSEIDLGPRTMRALSRQVVNMIAIDQNSIASAANAGNARSSWRGGRR